MQQMKILWLIRETNLPQAHAPGDPGNRWHTLFQSAGHESAPPGLPLDDKLLAAGEEYKKNKIIIHKQV